MRLYGAFIKKCPGCDMSIPHRDLACLLTLGPVPGRQADRFKILVRARDRSLARLREGMDLGTGGHIDWSRDSAHER